jgi:glycosyltransferase involved in cell wall biosynthesis
MKVAIVSTFRTMCGIALYTENLVNDLSKLTELKIFAELLETPQTEKEALNKDIHIDFERCWSRYRHFEELEKKIIDYSPDIVHVQFVAGLFNELSFNPNSMFHRFLSNIRQKGIKIVITLHDVPGEFSNPEQLLQWYKNFDAHFIGINNEMVGGLKKWYPDAQATVIPIGSIRFVPYDKNEARKILKLNENDFILTQIGFYGADKGMLEIIQSVTKISIPKFKLAFAGGFHPLATAFYKPYVGDCIKTAIKLGVANKIIFLGKLLSEDEINLWASATDFIIVNLKSIFGYSGSASIKRTLVAGKPILIGDDSRLSEFKDNVNCIKFSQDNIAKKIIWLYEHPEIQKLIIEGALQYARETTFDIVAQKHMDVYESCLS